MSGCLIGVINDSNSVAYVQVRQNELIESEIDSNPQSIPIHMFIVEFDKTNKNKNRKTQTEEQNREREKNSSTGSIDISSYHVHIANELNCNGWLH